MKITKFVHSCLLVEMPERTALFDPGSMSAAMLKNHNFEYLDDIVITHVHMDHMDIPTITMLAQKFPKVRITAPGEALEQLHDAGLAQANNEFPQGFSQFDAPHETVEPMFDTPEEFGYHYLDLLTHPGDSHSFNETMPILALPMTAPWGATVKAVQIGLDLKPQYIVPIHDWHWHEAARESTYDGLEQLFKKNGITFIKPKNGEPFTIDI